MSCSCPAAVLLEQTATAGEPLPPVPDWAYCEHATPLDPAPTDSEVS